LSEPLKIIKNASINGPQQAFLLQITRQCWYFHFLIAVIAITLGACSKSPAVPKLDASAIILAFGDSLTFGTGAVTNESYPAQLQKLISRNVVASGVPGETSAEGLARLPQTLEEHKPRLLILCHGGNDFLRKLGDEQARSNVRAMVKLALDKGIPVVLIATPKPGLVVKTPDFYREIASEFAIPLDDAMLKKVLTDNELKSDLVHPNAKGYSHIAEELAKILKRSGAI
jgi:acyl-CoA thioesterase I